MHVSYQILAPFRRRPQHLLLRSQSSRRPVWGGCEIRVASVWIATHWGIERQIVWKSAQSWQRPVERASRTSVASSRRGAEVRLDHIDDALLPVGADHVRIRASAINTLIGQTRCTESDAGRRIVHCQCGLLSTTPFSQSPSFSPPALSQLPP